MRKQIAIPLLIFVLIVTATIGIIVFGKGYRFNFGTNGTPAVQGTGLLVATSAPDGAQVFINDHLTTATDNTINLTPGEYKVKIYKEGYFPWEKKIIVKKEVVSKADALLLPSAPKLESITNVGVANPVLDPTGTKIAYTVASQSAAKNGIYVLDMTLRPIITFQNASTQIASNNISSFSNSFFMWSPDSKQLLVNTSELNSTSYLLSANSLNTSPQDVTETLSLVKTSWEKLKEEKQKAFMDSLNKKLKPVVATYFNVLQWSDDETKILYTASVSANLPIIKNPPLIGVNSTPEQRGIQKASIYVYDVKEDRNYKILDLLPALEADSRTPIMFSPDSKHLIYVHNGKIDVMEYDGANQTTVYAGPFVDHYVFPWPDATKVVILTNLGNLSLTPNLYTISLK